MKTLMTTTAGILVALGTAASAQSIDVSGAVAQGDTVTLPTVNMTSNGYVVLHQVEDGQPVVPQSIGHTAVTEGANTDVAITAEMAFEPGTRYAAMLHDETNGNDTYEFGPGSTEVDTPTMVNGSPVVSIFTVGTPAGDTSASGDMSSGSMGSDEPLEGTSPENDTPSMDAPMEGSGATAQ